MKESVLRPEESTKAAHNPADLCAAQVSQEDDLSSYTSTLLMLVVDYLWGLSELTQGLVSIGKDPLGFLCGQSRICSKEPC